MNPRPARPVLSVNGEAFFARTEIESYRNRMQILTMIDTDTLSAFYVDNEVRNRGDC